MKKTSILKYDKTLVLSESDIINLSNILGCYCTELNYRATTYDETSIAFESIQELLSYDNFKKGKIKTLRISGFNQHHRIFELTFYGQRSSAPYVECEYSFKNTDDEISFTTKLNSFFEKTTEAYYQYMISTLSVLFALIGVLIYIVKINWPPSNFLVLATTFDILMAYYLIDRKLLKFLFPSITFLWGEEIKKHSKRTDLRKQLFWGVIITVIISIFVTKVFS